MLRVFTGFDPREAEGWHVFMASVLKHCGPEVAVSALNGRQGDGTNTFTYERFRVPEYCAWGGMAIYLDASDMLLRDDLMQLAKLFDPRFAVQVVKHEYQTKHPRKYIGTAMESDNQDYPRKNWSSVILWNCGHTAHFRNRIAMRGTDGKFLHRFAWLKDKEIGELPIEWNWLPQEHGDNPDAKILHYTAGIPGFKHYADAPMSGPWHESARTLHSER
jgi:hypothetical protein